MVAMVSIETPLFRKNYANAITISNIILKVKVLSLVTIR